MSVAVPIFQVQNYKADAKSSDTLFIKQTPDLLRTTFVNLELKGFELRRLSLHLLSDLEANDSGDSDKKDERSTVQGLEEVSKIEDQLVKTITSEAELTASHKKILELAKKLSEAEIKRKESLLQQVISLFFY